MPLLTVREATARDAPAIAALFHETVRIVNSHHYTESQIRAWAGVGPEPDRWLHRMEGRTTIVASRGGELVGFGAYESGGLVDTLYVHHAHQNEGIATRILERIEAVARQDGVDRLVVEASITARPFFERRGFVVVRAQHVVRREVRLRNYRMEKTLAGEG